MSKGVLRSVFLLFKALILPMLILITSACYAQVIVPDSLLDLNSQNKDTLGIQASLSIGEMLNDQDTALHFFNQALDRSAVINYQDGIIKSYQNLSKFYRDKRIHDKSLGYLEIALEQDLALTDELVKADILSDIGWHFHFFEDYPKSIEYYLQSQKICEKYEDYRCSIFNLINSALVYSNIESYDDANQSLHDALRLIVEQQDTMNYLICSVNLASNYRGMNKLDSTIYYAKIALQLSNELDILIGKVRSSNILAVAHLDKGQFEVTSSYADSILNSGTDNKISLSLAHKYKAASLDSMGFTFEAFQHAERGLEYAIEFGDNKYIMNGYWQLYLLHKENNNHRIALDFYEKHEVLEDSIFSFNNKTHINELKEAFESERKELEIQSLTQKQEIQKLNLKRNSYFFAGIIGLLISIGGFGFFTNRNRILQKDKETLIAKQRLFRAQINPHFLFNALNSIQNIIYIQNNPRKAAGYLSKFAQLMRSILESSAEDFVSLDEELKTIKSYLELQKLRFESKFDFDVTVDKSINVEETLIPAMLTQPFLENCITHAFPDGYQKGNIKVDISKGGDELYIQISDNGVGIDQARHKKVNTHISRALKISRQRLEILRKKLKRDVVMNMIDRSIYGEKGTQVDIKLPLLLA